MTTTNTLKKVKTSFNVFYKTTLLHKVLYGLSLLVALFLMFNYGKSQVEGFEQKTNKFKMFTEIPDIYDDFYISLYDDLVFSKLKNDFEVTKIIKNTKPTNESKILDIGSGKGHHVSSFVAHGFKSVGIDISPSMVKESKKTYPELKFKLADATNSSVFQSNEFSHITCFYFTIYYIQNKQLLFQNAIDWLMPGGYLIIHLVNRDRFDPILPPGNPLSTVSVQKYAKKRITTTTINFNEFVYKSNFKLNNEVSSIDTPNAFMVESFKNNKNGNVRKHEHQLYMLTQSEILKIAKDVGFIVHSKIDLVECQYDNQYIYILQKPN
jgi:SAM-dependent methyltransferase